MGVHCHRQLTLSFAAMAFLLFASVSALEFSPARQFSVGVRKIREEVVERLFMARRRLGGPGSSPPSCRSKCERCAPCKPVHVPVQPGMSMPLEYYPEAWRCKCGNKLFMP
ncbi:epidermal patterning factor-like protein 4 [Phtheirospermum japonicum]|uniref:Epidermal patterning factor-like protein n=1 Tax=Phtheirospermum japonicum TaxID=374723 RepID=A0A830BGL3_9LAMI|nr:epidermal patterning factor-like protein 4 [Phtheirospermum japonicum]